MAIWHLPIDSRSFIHVLLRLYPFLEVPGDFQTLAVKKFQPRVRITFQRNILANNMLNFARFCVNTSYRSAHDSDVFGNIS